jgi:signal peptidase I
MNPCKIKGNIKMVEESGRDMSDSNSEQLNKLKLENNSSQDFFGFLIDLLKTGLVVFIFAFILRYFVVQPYIVDGESMMPTYENNEYLLAEKISYIFGEPKRGDVVVFRYPKNPNLNYIKRIIGLPGETVTIEDDSIKITNKDNPQGFVLNEKYIPGTTETLLPEGSSATRTLRENEYFVLGDNREHSSDSREWGVLPKTNIAGRSWVSIAKLGNANNRGLELYFKVHERAQYTKDLLNRSLLGFGR